jgi:hypothetical protein
MVDTVVSFNKVFFAQNLCVFLAYAIDVNVAGDVDVCFTRSSAEEIFSFSRQETNTTT